MITRKEGKILSTPLALILITERNTGMLCKLLVKEQASDDKFVEDIFFIQYFQLFMTEVCFVGYLK